MHQQQQRQQSQQKPTMPRPLPTKSDSPDILFPSLKLPRTVSPALRGQPSTPSGNRTMTLQALREQNTALKTKLKGYERSDLVVTYSEIAKMKDRIIEQERMISGYRAKGEGREQREIREVRDFTQKADIKENADRADKDWKAKIADKDHTIAELKRALNNLKDAAAERQSNGDNEVAQLQNRVKVLTIQNLRLGDIVERLNKRNLADSGKQSRDLEVKVEDLVSEKEQLVDKLMNVSSELIQVNAALDKQTKINQMLESKNKNLEQENDKLVRILREQRSQSKPESRFYQDEVSRLTSEIRLLKEKTPPEKNSIIKIRQQYNQNLRLFQELAINEIEKQFNIFQKSVGALEAKIMTLQRHLWQRLASSSPIISRFNPAQQTKKFFTLSSFEQTRGEANETIAAAQPLSDTINQLKEELSFKTELLTRQEQKLKELEGNNKPIEEIPSSSGRLERHFEIVKKDYEESIERLRKLHREEMEDFRASTEEELGRLVGGYTQKIRELEARLSEAKSETSKQQQYRFQSYHQAAPQQAPQPPPQQQPPQPQPTAPTTAITSIVFHQLTQVRSRHDSSFQVQPLKRQLSNLKSAFDLQKAQLDHQKLQNTMIPQLKKRIEYLEGELLKKEELCEEIKSQAENRVKDERERVKRDFKESVVNLQRGRENVVETALERINQKNRVFEDYRLKLVQSLESTKKHSISVQGKMEQAESQTQLLKTQLQGAYKKIQALESQYSQLRQKMSLSMTQYPASKQIECNDEINLIREQHQSVLKELQSLTLQF